MIYIFKYFNYQSKEAGRSGSSRTHGREKCKQSFCSEIERNYALRRLGVDWRMIFKLVLKKQINRASSGVVRFRRRARIFRFHKMGQIS
jgi:hypothetical protein